MIRVMLESDLFVKFHAEVYEKKGDIKPQNAPIRT